MKRIVEIIRDDNTSGSKKILTALDGADAGKKALLSDSGIVYKSAESIKAETAAEIARMTDSAVVTSGGRKYFCDILENEMKIVICGAGHVAVPVIKLGIMIGAEVTVIEDREYFAHKAAEAGAQNVLCEPFGSGLDKIKGSADTYFILLTRGPAFDQTCIEKILEKDHAYLGMLGSRKRMNLIRDSLIKNGYSQEDIDSVHAPIGLDIGAESPAEISIAIMGQIIRIKKKKTRTSGFTKEMINELLRSHEEKKVIATIIERDGSAPRGPGTKMVVTRDRMTGTIGGGSMEAHVAGRARRMIDEGTPEFLIVKEDITLARTKHGSINGGTLSVMLELF